MAKILEYMQHNKHGIVITVTAPEHETRPVSIGVDFDWAADMESQEFSEICDWMREKAKFITEKYAK